MLQAQVMYNSTVSALRAELEALETAGEQRCQELQSQHQADTLERQLEGKCQLGRLRAEHETALNVVTQGLRSELEAQKLQAKAEMQSAVQQVREGHATELTRLRYELEQEQAQLLQVSILQRARQSQGTSTQIRKISSAVICAWQTYKRRGAVIDRQACRASSIGQIGAPRAFSVTLIAVKHMATLRSLALSQTSMDMIKCVAASPL